MTPCVSTCFIHDLPLQGNCCRLTFCYSKLHGCKQEDIELHPTHWCCWRTWEPVELKHVRKPTNYSNINITVVPFLYCFLLCSLRLNQSSYLTLYDGIILYIMCSHWSRCQNPRSQVYIAAPFNQMEICAVLLIFERAQYAMHKINFRGLCLESQRLTSLSRSSSPEGSVRIHERK